MTGTRADAPTVMHHSRLAPGAVYAGDEGRHVCRDCASPAARATGRDATGNALERTLATVTCACGAVTLTAALDPHGWPLPTSDPCPTGGTPWIDTAPDARYPYRPRCTCGDLVAPGYVATHAAEDMLTAHREGRL